jgi:predicted Zn-dependent protease
MKVQLTEAHRQVLTQTVLVVLWLATITLLLLPYLDLAGGLFHARLNFYSVDDDKQFGQEWADRIQKSNALVRDPVVSLYVQQLGEKVAATVAEPEFQFRFHVQNSQQINARAFPGGHIYVNLGLLLAVRNEAELAGVLAHEIGHVLGRHGTKHMSHDQLVQGAVALGNTLVFGPSLSSNSLAGLLTNLGSLSYSRWDEQQADDFAVDSLYAAGYHPEATATFLDLLWQKREGAPVQFLSTHPLSEQRAARARWRFSAWPIDGRWVTDSPAFQEAKIMFRSSVHFVRGAGLLRKGQSADAQDEFEKALALNPRNAEAHVGRAVIIGRIGLEDAAYQNLRTAIEVNPHLVEAYEVMDVLLTRKRNWDAIIYYWNLFVTLHPDNGKGFLGRGLGYLRKGDLVSAQQDVQHSCSLGFKIGCQVSGKLSELSKSDAMPAEEDHASESSEE